MVDRTVSIVAKMEECVVHLSRETQAMLARGTQPSILGEVEVGVIVQHHLKHGHQKYRNLYKSEQQ
jgi:hypothetical protein